MKSFAAFIRTPRSAYITLTVVVLAGLVALPQLGQQLLPSFKGAIS